MLISTPLYMSDFSSRGLKASGEDGVWESPTLGGGMATQCLADILSMSAGFLEVIFLLYK